MSYQGPHHYYGHVEDVKDVNFGWWMFGLPLTVLLVLFLIAIGAWPILLLLWLLPEGKK